MKHLQNWNNHLNELYQDTIDSANSKIDLHNYKKYPNILNDLKKKYTLLIQEKDNIGEVENKLIFFKNKTDLIDYLLDYDILAYDSDDVEWYITENDDIHYSILFHLTGSDTTQRELKLKFEEYDSEKLVELILEF